MATLTTLIHEEQWHPTEEIQRTGVLKSASDLFAVIKKSLLRCSRFVSRGKPMLDLSRAFQVLLGVCVVVCGCLWLFVGVVE